MRDDMGFIIRSVVQVGRAVPPPEPGRKAPTAATADVYEALRRAAPLSLDELAAILCGWAPFEVDVFIWAVGALGFFGWAMKEMPEAQKRGSLSAPGICLANSGAKLPCTVEVWQPTFSNTRPDISDMTPPPPLLAARLGARPGRAGEASGRLPGIKRRSLGLVLDRLERRADPIPQGLEPRSRAVFAGFDAGRSRPVHSSSVLGFACVIELQVASASLAFELRLATLRALEWRGGSSPALIGIKVLHFRAL